MSREQVAGHFLGYATDLRPIEHTEGAIIRGKFYRKVLDRDTNQVGAAWAKLVFTGTGHVPREEKTSDEMKGVVAFESDAIGYINASEVDHQEVRSKAS